MMKKTQMDNLEQIEHNKAIEQLETIKHIEHLEQVKNWTPSTSRIK